MLSYLGHLSFLGNDMASVLIRNVSEDIDRALKVAAAKHNRSKESEAKMILENTLLSPKKRSLLDALSEIPSLQIEDDFFDRGESDREI